MKPGTNPGKGGSEWQLSTDDLVVLALVGKLRMISGALGRVSESVDGKSKGRVVVFSFKVHP